MELENAVSHAVTVKKLEAKLDQLMKKRKLTDSFSKQVTWIHGIFLPKLKVNGLPSFPR